MPSIKPGKKEAEETESELVHRNQKVSIQSDPQGYPPFVIYFIMISMLLDFVREEDPIRL